LGIARKKMQARASACWLRALRGFGGGGMSLDREFTERVKKFHLVQEVIPKYIPDLKRSGQNLVGRCPFCQGKKFNVHPPKSLWKCFGCDLSGDVVGFLMRVENRKFPDVIQDLAKQAGIPVPQDVSWNKGSKKSKAKTPPRASGASSPHGGHTATETESSSRDASSASVSSPSPAEVSGEASVSDAEAEALAGEIDARIQETPGLEGAEVRVKGGVVEVAVPAEEKDLHPDPGEADPNQAADVGVPQVQPETSRPEGESPASTDAAGEAGESDNKIIPGPGADRKPENTLKKHRFRVLPDLPESSWPRAFQLLQEFYDGLELKESDEDALFQRRGLEVGTSRRLGFRTNQSSNGQLLDSLGADYTKRERVDSGLFYRNPDGSVRRVKQFFGWGLVGRKVVDGEKKEEWGWTNPVLIPYFDAAGRLVSVRPHKGGARAGRLMRPRLYVPRLEGKGTWRTFDTVVITESEFKCAALYQMIGEGSPLSENDHVGVCGVPGIQQFRNAPVQCDIMDFLAETMPRTVVVIFDSEEKGDPRLPGYNEEFEKRHDSLIYAAVLAEKISEWFPTMTALVGQLPDDWRDDSGKADWDGCLSGMLGGRIELVG